jgi:hypothetical protein
MRENIIESPSETIRRAFELIREPNVIDACVAIHCGRRTRLVWITDIEAVTREVDYLRGTGGIVSGILVVEPFKVRAICLPNIPSKVAKKLLQNFMRAIEGHVDALALEVLH